MTQAPSVYGDLTVHENLRYFARVLEAPPKRVDEVIEAVGLEAERDRVVDRLSGGQRTRVSLAAALVGRAARCSCSTSRPSGSIRCSAATSGQMFRELAADGTTLLVSSHVMDEADHCDELLLLHEGAAAGDRERRTSCAAARAPSDLEDGLPAPDRGGAPMSLRSDLGDGAPRSSPSSAATRGRSRCCWSCPSRWSRS